MALHFTNLNTLSAGEACHHVCTNLLQQIPWCIPGDQEADHFLSEEVKFTLANSIF
jgi:hypothetical protein